MSDRAQSPRPFLGRPRTAYPGYVPPPIAGAPAASRQRSRAGRLWLVQALTGAALVVALGVHLVAQHFLAPGGLRDYANVVDYLRQPLAALIEVALLASVVVHASLGIRSSLVDVLGDVALRRVSLGMAGAAIVTIGYGLWLIISLLTAAA